MSKKSASPIRPYETSGTVHAVKQAIEKTIADSGNLTAESAEELASQVMVVLDEMRLVSYNNEKHLPLLTAAGRCLVMILEDPDITQREISLKLGTTENNVQKAIERLVANSLVKRQKAGAQNHYSVDPKAVLGHPDIWRLVTSLADIAEI